MALSTKRAPKVRADGRCYVCLGVRAIPETRQKGVPVSTYVEDPFCSAVCSRKYYGVELKVSPSGTT